MDKYNYYHSVLEDVKQYINDEINLEEWRGNKEGLEEKLNDDLWIDDSVTGNGSGSYTFNAWKAEQNLLGNRDLMKEVIEEFGIDAKTIVDRFYDPEYWDVSIRCLLLSRCIADALEEYEDELNESEAS